jgi:hypothetical protein
MYSFHKFFQVVTNPRPGIFLPEWARSALVDSAGNIYMPAACLDIEGASCPDIIGIIMAARDGQPIAMIEGHAFVRIEWVARTWPHMTAAVDQIGRKVAATLAGYDPLNDSPSNPPQ